MRDGSGQRYPLSLRASVKARRFGLSACDVIQYQEAGLRSVDGMRRARSAGLTSAAAVGWSRLLGTGSQDMETTLLFVVEIMERYSLTYRDVVDYRDRLMPPEVQSATLDSLDALKRNGLTPFEISCYAGLRITSVNVMWRLYSAGVSGPDAIGFVRAGIHDVSSMCTITATGVTGSDWYFYTRAGRTPDEMRVWKMQGVDGALAFSCATLLGRNDFWFASTLAQCGMTGDLLREYVNGAGEFGNAALWLQQRTSQPGPGMSGDVAAVLHDAARMKGQAAFASASPTARYNSTPAQVMPTQRPAMAFSGRDTREARRPMVAPGRVSATSGAGVWPVPRHD